MSRYTPKRAPLAAGGGPARPVSPAKRAKPKAAAKKHAKPSAKPGGFPCATCKQPFRTEEARAWVAPVKKRNLEQHIRFIHESDVSL